jgi:hypothetical protein
MHVPCYNCADLLDGFRVVNPFRSQVLLTELESLFRRNVLVEKYSHFFFFFQLSSMIEEEVNS